MPTVATGPFWVEHFQDGVAYSVKHLHPVFVDFVVPAVAPKKNKPGRAEMDVKLRFVYSHHCFTQALDKNPGADPSRHYSCTKRPNDSRVFCAIRWAESFALPGIVTGLQNCYFTRQDNFFVWRNPTNPALDEYFVYFDVKRRSNHVEIEIQSAYPRADAADAKKGAQRVSFVTLIVNALMGRPTHRPPGP